MSTVYAAPNDSRLVMDSSSWATTRGNLGSAGAGVQITETSSSAGVRNVGFPARGGGSIYVIDRSYFPFDLSGESGTATSATLYLYSDNLGTADDDHGTVYLIEGAGELVGNVYDYGYVFTGSAGSTTLGRVMGSGVISTTLGYHTLTLNSAGLSTLNASIGSGTVTIGCIGYYDYNDTAPVVHPSIKVQIQLYYQNYTGTSRDPYLDITYAGATAVTDNATFFGCNF